MKKALTAILLARDSTNVKKDHALTHIVALIQNAEVTLLSADLEKMLGNESQMMYPSRSQSLRTPHEHYTKDTAQTCLKISKMILEITHRLMLEES